jgi:hypothetical protein
MLVIAWNGLSGSRSRVLEAAQSNPSVNHGNDETKRAALADRSR